MRSLSRLLADGPVVLFFYPKAMTTGCTKESCHFRDLAAEFAEAGATRVGISADAVDRLNFIRRGRSAGLTLAQIREVLELRDAGATPCRHVKDLLDARLTDLDRQIAELQALRETVAHLHEDASTADPDACRPQDICRYL